MKNNPLVSIAIPAYKSNFLSEAIESALNQTYKNIELIIVNDNSPQNIDSIVQQYAKDPRLYYYKNEKNIGGKDPVANWNKCLSYAKGEFFALLCDDDFYEPTFIEELLLLTEKFPNCNVFRTGVNVIDKNYQIINYYPSSPEWESTIDYIWHVSLSLRKQTVSEWMYRRKHILTLNGYENIPMAWGADYYSIFKFSLNGGIASSYKRLATFRRSGINISTVHNKNMFEKLEGTKLYAHKLKELVIKNNLNLELLLPCIERIKSKEFSATISMMPITYIIQIIFKKKDFGISTKTLLKGLFNKALLKI